MANQSRETRDDSSAIADVIEASLPTVVVSTSPIVFAGVNRKVNIGNYENIDVYLGLALPVSANETVEELMNRLGDKIAETADAAIKVAASETYQRYLTIKELASGA